MAITLNELPSPTLSRDFHIEPLRFTPRTVTGLLAMAQDESVMQGCCGMVVQKGRPVFTCLQIILAAADLTQKNVESFVLFRFNAPSLT